MVHILLTVAEAAEMAGVSLWKMNTDLIKREGFPVVRVGRRVYIHRQKFIDWWGNEVNRQAEAS
jgi:excisionase family DNA binding protein